jgi:uncharacterized repeat protein (TIGR03803 family)
MNRRTMSWAAAAAALLVSVTARTGKTSDISTAASQAVALDAAAATVSESVLWSFGATSDDGTNPVGNLIADRRGNLYSTTFEGGVGGRAGTVFELSPPTSQRAQWRERVLWHFNPTNDDGAGPDAGLLADQWDNLYGTTLFGGANEGGGTVFELTSPTRQQTQWSERVLWSFSLNGAGGWAPVAGLIADQWGNLYGTTRNGGANNVSSVLEGTVFELSPPTRQQTQWSERVLWSFGEAGDGFAPAAGLLADGRGNLYGTTSLGGASSCNLFQGSFPVGCGTIFEISPPAGQQTQWSERVLWSFGASGGDGVQPVAGLIADKWGNLYGTTDQGGANNAGTVFELSPPTRQQSQWSERVLWSFGANDDGVQPVAGLIANRWGNLYGTTAEGGAKSNGTVFELSPPTSQNRRNRASACCGALAQMMTA